MRSTGGYDRWEASDQKVGELTQLQQNKYPVMSLTRRVLGGFAPTLNTTLRYVQTFTLQFPAGGSDSHQFDMRNLFDPDVALGGHQPSNFDRLTTIYARWTVVKTRLRVVNAWNSTSSVSPGVWGFLVSKTGSLVAGFSTPEGILEQPYCKYSNVASGLANIQPYPGSLDVMLPSTSWLGLRSKDLLFSDGYTGTNAGGPADTFYAEVFNSSINGGPSPATPVPFRIEIEYDAVFFEPLPTLPS
jgi:hypothetical protein